MTTFESMNKWKCDLGNGEFDHDWRYADDWSGDPGVIGGTFDCGKWVCQICGLEDLERKPPTPEQEHDLT